ncbi:hypothetical protein DTO282F9_2715 [Paecilomyces variotii]|nr:hypothetical protein DTO063F5_2788 [Paecilomyces variotii]KAJ9400247.1 hypothetical protein DTO282F9_2715 [Paecilomyces variotii]
MGPGATIERYFTRERKLGCSTPKVISVEECPGDDGEVTNAVNAWQSRHEYKDSLIGNLDPGPTKVKITVRAISIYDVCASPQNQRAAKGYFKILAKDNTGCMLINLWYINAEYRIGIGSLLTIWAPHVSPKTTKVQDNPARLTTSLFPERDSACHVTVHPDTLLPKACRVPVGYREGHSPSGLVSLGELRESARSGQGPSVLVLVKVVGNITSVTNSRGQTTEKVDIGVCDESGEAILTLYGMMMLSSRKWTPFSTVLLVSGARWKPTSRLSTTAATTIEVDPDILEAQWLRKSLRRLSMFVNQQYTEDVFDIKTFESAVVKLRFTLADLDESIRAQPHGDTTSSIYVSYSNVELETYTGYMNLMITAVNLVSLYKRRRLYNTGCCNMPLFSNFPTAACGQCGKSLKLSLNLQVIGALTDETGNISSSYPSSYNIKERYQSFHSISGSKNLAFSPILWSREAWRALLGVEPDKLLADMESPEEEIRFLTLIQSHLLFLRMTIIFKWSDRYGKLLVCRVVP